MSSRTPATIELNFRSPLIVEAPWDPAIKENLVVGDSFSWITASNEGHIAHHYCIDLKNYFLPFFKYVVTDVDYRKIAINESPENSNSAPTDDKKIPAELETVARSRKFYIGHATPHDFTTTSPLQWPISRAMLIAAGSKEEAYNKLSIRDPGVQTLLLKYYGPSGDTVSVGSVTVPLRLVPLTAAAFIALACCHLIGSWSAMRGIRRRGESETMKNRAGWIMLDCSQGLVGLIALLAAAVLCVSVLSIPTYAALQTWRLRWSEYSTSGLELAALFSALILLLFTLLVNIVEQFQLRATVRHRVLQGKQHR